MKLIAFTGLAGSGKTTAAKALEDRNYRRYSFADPLRAMMKVLDIDLDGATSEFKNTGHPHLCGRTPRYALQRLGTEWGRQMIGQSIWVDATRRRLVQLLPHLNVVIDDCRFNDEAQMIRDLGGVVVCITRPGIKQMDHASEAGIKTDLINYWLSNHGTEAELVKLVGRLV